MSNEDTMSGEIDILQQVENGWNACCHKNGCAYEITRLRGEIERLDAVRLDEVAANKKAHEMLCEERAEAQRLRGEVDRLNERLSNLHGASAD